MATYRFSPKNLTRYAGDPNRIVARSKWELMYMQALDGSNLVVKWCSEPRNLNITYISPLDRKVHSYYPDFIVQWLNGQVEIIEIKPLKEALAEKAVSTYDKLSLLKNVAKWQAADRFAQTIGARFRVITEGNLFAKKSTKAPKRARPTKKTKGTTK